MAIFVGGKELDTWVDLGGGDQSSTTTYVDFDWDSFRSDGYKIFKIFVTDCWMVDGYKFEMAFLTTDNTVPSSGLYGGAYAHGEGDPNIAGYDIRYNNTSYVPLSADRVAASLSGAYRGNFEITVNTGNDAAGGVPNYWWHGTMRVANTLASHIAGAGTCTQNARYGIRLKGNATNALLKMRYKVLGMKNT